MPGTDPCYIRSRRAAGDPKNQAVIELYVRATDEEKAAALDAAIEYEDEDLRQELVMIEKDFLKELVEATQAYEVAEARVKDVCRAIASQGAIKKEMDKSPAPRGGRRKVNRVNKVNDVPPAGDGVIKTKGQPKLPGTPEYWKRVQCPVCHQQRGSRLYDGQRYPVLHRDESTGETCKGSFVAVATEA